MKMGFVKPSYPCEKRVGLLPKDAKQCFGKILVESGYGEALGIDDCEYKQAGALLLSREEIFSACDFIYSLKLLQPSDYPLLREGHTVIGWTHPTGSGHEFFATVCQEKNIRVVDLDSKFPRLYYLDKVKTLDSIPKGFVDENSRLAGFASVQHALFAHGMILKENNRVAVLSIGNVAQGALLFLNKTCAKIDIYTRSNINKFLDAIGVYDVIVSGIEVDTGHVIESHHKKKINNGALVIDAAADGDGAIQGTRYTTIDNPIYSEDGVFYYVVNNSPSVFYREASHLLSRIFSQAVYSQDPRDLIKL